MTAEVAGEESGREMMVETILESSQDFGMSNGALPQWKRELLQRRAAKSRPAAPPPAPPPPPPPPLPPTDDDSEELRYGPGIVKRLKSRYLSLALRDAPRRRPSVLRRAASLEHLLDERPPAAPRARLARPVSVAAAPAPPAPAPRRDCVKRARSVDALSRLEAREELAPPSPSPPPPPPAPRPPTARAARPPRRPAPLLREAERPPPDVVRSTLRKFESAPSRRAAPAARVPAVLRGLEGRRSVTPECVEPAPSPAGTVEDAEAPDLPATPPPPSTPAPQLPQEPFSQLSPEPTAQLQPEPTSQLPPEPTLQVPAVTPSQTLPESTPQLSPEPPALLPSTTQFTPPTSPASALPKYTFPPILALTSVGPAVAAPPAESGSATGGAVEEPARAVSRAALEGIARAGCSVRYAFSAARGGSHLPPLAATNPVLTGRGARRVGVIRPMPASPRAAPPLPPPGDKSPERAVLTNGHSTPEPRATSRIGAAGIERAWSGSPAEPRWPRAPRARAPPPAATSVVFNFSDRKEVPDYIENDGIVLRGSRRPRIKAGEAGVVVLRAGADAGSDSESEVDGGPPSPCAVRFLNDNVLINGRSSMPHRPNRDRIAKLKLQFDDSLTRTFEYPSETSLCEDAPEPAPPATPATPAPDVDGAAHLVDNTHIASAALSRYTPHKTAAATFQLGVTRQAGPPAAAPPAAPAAPAGEEGGDARPCGADVARSWSDARALNTDLLF